MVLGIITGIFSIGLGVSLVFFWIIVFCKKQTQKYINEPLERYFHIIAEYVMATLAIISGIAILLETSWGLVLFILTMGFMIYATINAIGIYGQKKYWGIVILLVGIAILSTIFVILNIVKM